MADTSTERARRSRAHARDDHAMCRPQRCGVARAHDAGEHSRCSPDWCEHAAAAAELAEDQAASAGAGPTPPPDPEQAYRVRSTLLEEDAGEFGPAGRVLWDAVTAETDLGPLQTELLREACRTADRLRALDLQLRGDGPWLDLTTMDGRTFVIVVTDVLKESRAQALALKQLISELRQSGTAGRAGNRPPAPDGPDKGEGASIVDLSAAIRAKLAAAAQD